MNTPNPTPAPGSTPPATPAVPPPGGARSGEPPRLLGGLNFWQWLGIAIIVVIALWMVYDRLLREPPAPNRQITEPAETQAEGISGGGNKATMSQE